jgi:hypothetical protein
VGTFESFTTEGCPDGFISIKEGNRPTSGGKWCGSAWGYTVYYSETSSVNLTLRLERFPQQVSSNSLIVIVFLVRCRLIILLRCVVKYALSDVVK